MTAGRATIPGPRLCPLGAGFRAGNHVGQRDAEAIAAAMSVVIQVFRSLYNPGPSVSEREHGWCSYTSPLLGIWTPVGLGKVDSEIGNLKRHFRAYLDPKGCEMIAFCACCTGFGPQFYIPLGVQVQCPEVGFGV